MTDQQARERVQAIIQKSYTQHGFQGRAWGASMNSPGTTGLTDCSYAHGCAIGLSLPYELACQLDEAGGSTIGVLIYERTDVRRELFGIDDRPPQWAQRCLTKAQVLHDQHARAGDDDRESYRAALEKLAEAFGFTLTRPEQA